jgi:hypothetical protein
MAPLDLIVWALASAVSLIIVGIPLGMITLLIAFARGKISDGR